MPRRSRRIEERASLRENRVDLTRDPSFARLDHPQERGVGEEVLAQEHQEQDQGGGSRRISNLRLEVWLNIV